MRTKTILYITLVVMLFLGGTIILKTFAAEKSKPSPQAVETARQTVKMLDDVHKGYVVTITQQYVKAKETRPAASVAKKVFKHMQNQGWGTTRLVDATGEPFNKENAPKTEFEKRAIEALKKGKSYYEEVDAKNKPVLRAATVVPVVMKECINCHVDKKMGELLGALVYEVPIR